jgi:methyl-accepting chemotaxis protein
MFNNIKIGTRITGSIIFIILMSEAIGFYALLNLSNLSSNLKQISNIELSAVDSLKGIDKEVNSIVSCQRGLALSNMFDNEKVRKDLFTSVTESWDRMDKYLKKYKDLPKGAEEEKMWNELMINFGLWKTKHTVEMEALQNKQKLVEDGVSPKDARFQKWDKAAGQAELDARESLQATAKGLDKLVAVIVNRAVNSAEKARLSATMATRVFMISMIMGAVISILLCVFLSRSIAPPLRKGVLMMQELGRGHLSKRLNMERKDEIGFLAKAMDQFADNLQQNVIFNMQQISDGNIDIAPVIIDDKDEIGPALNKMIKAIGAMSDEISRCCFAALEGDLAYRADATSFHGKYKKIVQGFNDMIDAMMGPKNEVSVVLTKIARKDMTVRMMGEYKGDHAKTKDGLNMFVERMDKAMQQMAIGAEQVASASIQISTGGQSLSQGASEQASSLEEVSSSLQEMSSMIKQNAQNAREAKGVAEQALASADKGVESMNRMSSAINQIKSSSDSTARIVKTIDEIAFQTNLLALNAAVEAARAGDAGRGFAVVAEEVRNLAMRSAEAAKNTASLIEDAVKNSKNGVNINAEVLKNFQDIVEKSNKVSQVVAEIAAASDQQDQGISQLNRAVEQLNQLTQQNAANAEESASAAEEMSLQAEEMRSMVGGFKLTGSGEYTQAMQSSGQSGYLLHNPDLQGKGGRAAARIKPDPRKVIPLDEKDHSILKTF